MTFAKHLRQMRGDLTQSAFSKKLGIPFTTYHRYEKGLRVPDINVLAQIVKLTGVSADTLLGLKHKAGTRGVPDKKDLVIAQQLEELKKLRKKIESTKVAVRT